MVKSSIRGLFVTLAAVGLALAATTVVLGAGPTYRYTFETHAAFFSAETKQPVVVDPQVFVADPSAPAATGPQNIAHLAGYRPARPQSDSSTAPLFTARGRPLGFTLGAWLGASGRGTITCNGTTATATHWFSGLVPGGLYQLTRLQFTPQGPQRTPFGKPDGSDSTLTAASDGTATFTSTLPFCPDASEGVVLAYHSDKTTHGAAMGEIGVNLHNQLATRIAPAPGLPNTGAGGGRDGLTWGLPLLALALAAGIRARTRPTES